MSLFDYQPGKIQISFGVPGLDLSIVGLPGVSAHVTMKDWVSLQPTKNAQRFTLTRGILGEPFLDYNSDTSRTFTLSLYQTSDNIEQLRILLFLQTIGIAGFPFSVMDLSGKNVTSNFLAGLFLNEKRQKSIYAAGYILDEPSEGWGLNAATWDYKIAVTYGQTLYL